MSGLQAQPLSTETQFNWVFLVEILIVVVLTIFFLFYFNRLFATLVSYLIRAYTWSRYKAYVDIEALQISLLGGRVFFKSIRYHAHNVTIHVYEGHVTWRYWLRIVQDPEVFREDTLGEEKDRVLSSATSTCENDEARDEKPRKRSKSIGKEEKAGGRTKKEPPCRISVKVSGVEAFIYNRSPVYDAVVEATLRRASSKTKPPTSSSSDSKDGDAEKLGFAPQRMGTHATSTNAATPAERPGVPSFLRIFPVKIECKRAAAALGNENTTSVIVAKAERSLGTVDAGHSGPLDLWKLLFNFDINQVNVWMKPNRDYKELQLNMGQRVIRERERAEPETGTPLKQTAKKAQTTWSRIKDVFSRPGISSGSLRAASVTESKSIRVPGSNAPLDQLPGQGQWHGLMRYLDDDDVDEHQEWQQVEYAKSSELINCDKITMRFYWDMAGRVPAGVADSDTLLDSIYQDDINGSSPPDYGLDLGVHGGYIVYGPWADRQRLNLQPIFVPATYVDATPMNPLQPGDWRLPTIFKIKIIVEENVVLRVPTREESKDPRWKGRARSARPEEGRPDNATQDRKRWRRGKHGLRRKGKKGTTTADVRPYGWLDITIKKDSVVNYNMDMYPCTTGYRNALDLDIKGVEMSSSVNHGLLWRSGGLTLNADLSQPLEWNTLRKWPFNVVVHDLELFILRDHLFLIIDLVNDWASGAPSDFYTFVPYNYQLDLTFRNFVMYLNVNDANIINDPADFDRNDFLTLEGELRAILGIPMEHYRPKRNQISFDVLAQDMKMRMFNPPKSTFNVFIEDKVMAELPKLTLNGSFNSNQEIKAGNVDVLRMDIVGTGLNLKAFGFFVRMLVNIKENYFGDYLHFKTLEEFQGASDDLDEANAKTASFPKPVSINELDVILCIVAEDATVMFPTNLYSCREFVKVELPKADLDLRIVSYYLDMGLQLSPISLLAGSADSKEDSNVDGVSSGTQFYLQHVDLSGHRSFGLPPNEDAYVSQWDIDVGKITGELSSRFIRNLALAGQMFTFSISDAENALPVTSPAVVIEASFVQVQTGIVRLWLHAGNDAFLLDLEPVKVEVSDWASMMFSQRIHVSAPTVTFACVDGKSASRHRALENSKKPVRTYAFLETGVSFDVVGRKLHFDVETKRQQSHVLLHDQRTNRFPFLVRPEIGAEVNAEDDIDFQPPAMPYPYPPTPMTNSEMAGRSSSIKSGLSSSGSNFLRSKSSKSSLAASIKAAKQTSFSKRPGLLSLSTQKTNRTDSDAPGTCHSSGASSRSSSSGSAQNPHRDRLPGNAARTTMGLPSLTMAFSSPYSEPYFPLETIIPDETNVPGFLSAADNVDEKSDVSSIADVIEDPDLSYDAEHTSIMIGILRGIRAYVEPHVAITVSKLFQTILPKTPEEVMDYFQLSIMGTISTQNAEKHGHNTTVEIRTSLPAARLRVVNVDDGTSGSADQIDLCIKSLENVVRIRTQPSEAGGTHVLALHTIATSLGLELQQPNTRSEISPAVRVSVEDVLVWLALANTNAFHVSLRDTTLAVTSRQTKYLTSLALRMVPTINGIVSRLNEVMSSSMRRVRMLTYVLTHNGETLNDPPFMGRMLYLLRAYPDHFRNTDSWKILSRFRYILHNLPPDVLENLRTNIIDAKSCPEDAPREVIQSWTQWRHWDIIQPNQTVAFKAVFPEDEVNKLDPSDFKGSTITFRSESFQISIEHEEGNSAVIFEETSLGLENTPPTKPEGLMLVEANTRTKTLLQLHTDTIAISLTWALFHAAEDVLTLKDDIDKIKALLQSRGSQSTSRALEDGLGRHDLHVVFSTEEGSIAVNGINVRHVGRAEGMRLSVIGTNQASPQFGRCVSIILNVDAAITELYGPHAQIWQAVFTSPSLYLDHIESAADTDVPPTVTIAIAYDTIKILVGEQVPVILRIIDHIILDEVAKVQRLIESTKSAVLSRTQSTPTLLAASPTTTGFGVSPKLHVAILAGNIHFEVSLLSTLNFQLEGRAASVRVAPSLSEERMFSIDFDVGRQSHSFVNCSDNTRHLQGLLDVPPVNGHIGLELQKDETSISVFTTVEKVEIDAGAIQGVIAVINRPEVQNVISAIQAGVEDIQGHVVEVCPEDDRHETAKEAHRKQIAYDARFALLGVRVSATTPRVLGRSTAEVEFGIGPLHATASNRALPEDIIPQVRAQVLDIGASLKVREHGQVRPCGNVVLGVRLNFNNHKSEHGDIARELQVVSDGIAVNAYTETASTIVDVINHLQDRIKHLDLSREVDYLRRLRDERRHTVIERISGKQSWTSDGELPFSPEDLLSIKTTIAFTDIKASWLVDSSFAAKPGSEVDDVIFSVQSIEFTTRGGHEARLTIQDLQLQLANREQSKEERSLNSALLSEIGFSVGYWSVGKERSVTLRATGKPLSLRLESRFLLPITAVKRSIEVAVEQFRQGTETWQNTPTPTGASRTTAKMFDTKHLASILVEADFAGAQVHMQGTDKRGRSGSTTTITSQYQAGAQHGRYGQFAADGALIQTTLVTPGIAFKLEYNNHERQPTINGELLIDASKNMLLPNVVPLAMEVSDSVKELVREQKSTEAPVIKISAPEANKATSFSVDDSIITATPAKIFGKTKVDLGFRIAKQEFGLSCQPIARVDATAALEDFYVTMNTIESDEHGHFFAVTAVMTKLTAQLKHVYSREPTFSYDMDSVLLSAMNNKHLSGTPGISAILNINPTRLVINAKQFQDLLIFREIWLPPEIRNAAAAAQTAMPAGTNEFLVQKYQAVAAAAAFPWNATISIARLAVELDLGQSIGKSSFTIINLWASQQKSSNWEQNLCIGLDEMAMNSTGRMSGFIRLEKLALRTSIQWPEETSEATFAKTPLIQASVGFKRLRAKAAFDYQAFAFGDIEGFDFLMYNVRESSGDTDRLVVVLDCEKAYVFCTATSPAQAVGLYQAFDRLIQEKQTAYMTSLKDIEKHVRRESTVVPTKFGPRTIDSAVKPKRAKKTTISLHSDVVVTMGAICFGVYPSTFFDSQMLKLEANNIQARFAVGLQNGKITSGLGMTLGQLQVALSSVRRLTAVPKALEVTVDEVVNSALNAKGGIILRVPKVVASMQTWQFPVSNNVEYIFKSLFEGKIDVGWNLSRINFIKSMYETHARALASRLGKQSLSESAAVKITAADPNSDASQKEEKITAEINLPQSKYEYQALEPPIIETPQLRDMGEATPPLEWIGLHRERLPNVTHQILIVSLLEVCREVEDAYDRILGSSGQ